MDNLYTEQTYEIKLTIPRGDGGNTQIAAARKATTPLAAIVALLDETMQEEGEMFHSFTIVVTPVA